MVGTVAGVRRAFFIALVASGCGTQTLDPPTTTTFGGDRPVELVVPKRYDHAVPTPLVVLLHGFAAAAYLESAYVGLEAIADEKTFLYVAPEGLLDADGRRYWNGTDACCDFYDSGVDDKGYIVDLVDEIASEYNVDPDRVHLFGHSNGGFLAYRIGCEAPQRFASIVSLAGLSFRDGARCDPATALSVLQIHGTDDQIIPYEGGARPEVGRPHPSAPESTAAWAGYVGCGASRTEMERIDIDTSIRGEETIREKHEGCPEGIDVELWTVEDGGHIPTIDISDHGESFNRRVWDFMRRHPRN